MSDEIVWRQPPEHVLNQTRRTRYDDFAEALRKRPGQWAVLPGEKATSDSAKGTAMNLRNGRMSAFKPKGSYEAVVDGTTVYVKYIGKDSAATDGSEDQAEHVTVESGQRVAASVIRAWARENGFTDLPERGRLPGNVIAAFEEAQDGGDDAHLDEHQSDSPDD